MLPVLVGLLATALLAGPAGPSVPSVPTGTDVDYQLGGAVTAPDHVGIVVRDREAAPQAGRFNVCYVNGFQTQPHEKAFWRKRPALVLRDRSGEPVVDEAWGELLLDLRTREKRARIGRIVTAPSRSVGVVTQTPESPCESTGQAARVPITRLSRRASG